MASTPGHPALDWAQRDWLEPPDVQAPESLRSAVGGHPLVAETLARRGVAEQDAALAFLDPDRFSPSPPSALPGLTDAADLVERAAERGEPICVWGDFDVDGQTATALLVWTLRRLGASVTYHIPIRDRESHGVSPTVLGTLLDTGARLILTCDTGISAHQAVSYARSRGATFVITDHHELPPELPDAHAIVNPKLLPPSLAGNRLRDLPGVGVAFKLAQELLTRAGSPELADKLLDLVALGIVADLAVQAGEVRYLLQRGLAALRQTERIGLQALMANAELDPAHVTEAHVGYVIAPRLNALGRLGDANPAVEFLTTTKEGRARVLAAQLEALNSRRKMLCDQVEAGAEAQLAATPELLDETALVLENPVWPAGVIGIVASRLVERYGKPVVLLSAPPGESARGSARSVEGCNITAALAANAALLDSFGGHPMAAGLSMDRERIPELRRGLSATVSAMLAPERRGDPLRSPWAGASPAPTTRGLRIDGYLPLSDLTPELVSDLERLAPFGPGNPPLTLAARDVTVQERRAVGRNGEHLLMTIADAGGTAHKVIRWDGAGLPLPEGSFDLAYIARSSNFRGAREVQVEWVAARPVGAALAVAQIAQREVVDHRGAEDPLGVLSELARTEALIVWSEGAPVIAPQVPRDRIHTRRDLPLAPSLAIWTAPPGPAELTTALSAVQPQSLHLFAMDPGLDEAGAFLRYLSGLIKHALAAYAGRVSIPALAAATGQRDAAVRLGLEWLADRGAIAIVSGDPSAAEEIVVARAETGDLREAAARNSPTRCAASWLCRAVPEGGNPQPGVYARLRSLLEETAAYRDHFSRVDKDRLLA